MKVILFGMIIICFIIFQDIIFNTKDHRITRILSEDIINQSVNDSKNDINNSDNNNPNSSNPNINSNLTDNKINNTLNFDNNSNTTDVNNSNTTDVDNSNTTDVDNSNTTDTNSTDLDNNSTNTDNTNKPPRSGIDIKKERFITGSFINAIEKDYNKPLPKSAIIKYAITINRHGIYRPESDLLGTYNNTKPETLKSEEVLSNPEIDLSEIFSKKWKTKTELDRNGLDYAKKFGSDVKKFYKELNLLNFSISNQTDFISSEKNISITYTKEVIKNIFTNIKSTTIEETEFTFEYFDAFKFTHKLGYKNLAILAGTYNNLKFGFGYNNCPKFQNWVSLSEKDTVLKKKYISTFDKILTNTVNYFEKYNRTNYYKYYDLDHPYLVISENAIRNNFTLGKILYEALYANFINFKDDKKELEELYEIVPEKDLDLLRKMKNFFIYEHILYSHIHTFIIVAPFYQLMFKEFNKAISDPTYIRKFIYFAASDHIIASFYKLFYYSEEYYRDINETNEKKFKKYLFEDCPHLDYGFNAQFELWEDTDKNQKIYYVVFRENLSPQPRFVIKSDIFIDAIKLFYLAPNMSEKEREFWCFS